VFGACVQGVHTRWWHRCRAINYCHTIGEGTVAAQLYCHSYIYDRATTTSRTSFLVSAIISYQ
jgi:hypothetical protein